jgi:asparagine synthase (glutamine-hydrolysing)
MCGLNFILDKKSKLDIAPIQKMNKATQHRGPEVSTFLKLKNSQNQALYFGHNRLKIIDLSTEADQPFVSPDGRFILIFNGEIYNYQSLKNQLNPQPAWRTHSDTEVLLHYLIQKVSSLSIDNQALTAKSSLSFSDDLNGMYAFVFYDTLTEKLWLGRDKFGIKPLYRFENEDYIIISSEIKGILASGLVKKRLNEKQIYHYLQFKFAQAPATFFQDIEEVIPVNSNTALPTVNLSNTSQNTDNQLLTLNNIFLNVLERQIQADVPWGIFLSGGVDSTLLLAGLHELGHQQIPVFSVMNSAQEKSFGTADFHFARLAARQFNAQLTEIQLDSSILTDVPRLMGLLDQPIADSAFLLTHLITKMAQPKVKVALSGAGADELFGGYNRHWAYYQWLRYYKSSQPFIAMAKKLDFLWPDGFAHPWRRYFYLGKKFIRQIVPNSPYQTFINFTKLQTEGLISYNSDNQHFIEKEKSFNPLDYELNHFLKSDVLALSDQMTMAHSVELRVPYLDNELVTFAQNFPWEFHLKYGKKWLLKALLDQKGGQKFTQRSKEGFGMPIGLWLRQKNAKELISNTLQENNLIFQYLNYSTVKQMFTLHLQQKQDFSSELWALIVLHYWLNHHFS